jgi:hypothetical protein
MSTTKATKRIETPYGLAILEEQANGGWVIYVPWRFAGGNYRPGFGSYLGFDTCETRCREAIRLEVENRSARFKV